MMTKPIGGSAGVARGTKDSGASGGGKTSDVSSVPEQNNPFYLGYQRGLEEGTKTTT